ncbi:MAG: fused MFS/spermidine synthase [Lachnospiraceae bacterium]|nr:fused MFS/spermidine synthase [Lachnospiraceae bacterium]
MGTFLPTFVTIPAVGTAITFLLFSGVLLVLCLLYFVSPRVQGNDSEGRAEERSESGLKETAEGEPEEKGGKETEEKQDVEPKEQKPEKRKGKTSESDAKNKLRITLGIVIFAACCVFGHESSFAFWQEDLTYEGESVYNYLQVYEDDQKAVLSTNVLFGVQSVYRKEKSLTGMYYDYAMAAPLMAGARAKDSTDILILGMGTGTFATQCHRYFDGIHVEGVEIDEKITDLAHEYFALSEDTKVTTYDGRAYLAADKGKYDVIMVDAYQDITIPFQMSSVEFFTMVRDHLKEDGVMVVNMNMRGQKEGNINEYLSDTIAGVFDSVYTADVKGSTNRELFACCGSDIGERMQKALESYSDTDLTEDDAQLIAMMQRVEGELVEYEGGSYILTDDKAPVELLGMQVIDDLIRDEVSYYKDIYQQDGLKGLLEVL